MKSVNETLHAKIVKYSYKKDLGCREGILIKQLSSNDQVEWIIFLSINRTLILDIYLIE
ncbi:Uncharacterized protein APZ42_016075 [Daphnia magna]|uniref:Uncharacterized protein n=1 Tax=Daphnia magna TaxID=35525 RepID=A0A162NJN9_9CRUS|nr:Uncharacterized protein APZ42_016075 [Daphnia magna]